MIGIFADSGARLTISHNGLGLNVNTDAFDDTYSVDTVTVVPQYSTSVESHPNGNGSELSSVFRTFYLVRIDGVVRAPSLARLFDKTKALAKAFDPAVAYFASPATDGATALDFSVPTLDVANYPAGLVPSRFYARPRSGVIPAVSAFTGTACFFTAELLVPDPVRYSQATFSLSGSGAADLSAGDHPSCPTLAITMASAGSSAYAISCGSSSLVLNLSSRAAGQVVTVDMATKSIKVNGVETQSLYASGDWFALPAAANTIVYSNPTNATSVLTWRRAWTV